jgi:MYXO-CTERM domain-containing protein
MRFPPPGGAVRRATLRLRTSSSGSAAGGSGEICRVEGGVWDEATLTWATRPTVSTVCSGGARRVGPNEDVTWDVTGIVTGSGEQNLAIVSTDADGAHFLSREAGGCELGPRLEVELAPGTDSGAVPGTDSGTTSGDDAGAGVDAGRRGGVDMACACRAGSHRSTGARWALAALALALAWRARRR